nr:MAG TPA_asm: hypothetical protein [Caudoviricetes sp.]
MCSGSYSKAGSLTTGILATAALGAFELGSRRVYTFRQNLTRQTL